MIVSEKSGQEWLESRVCKPCALRGIPASLELCRECRQRPAKLWVTDPSSGKEKSFRLCEDCAGRAGWRPTPAAASGAREALAAYAGALSTARRRLATILRNHGL